MKIKPYFQEMGVTVAPTPTARPELGVAHGMAQLGQSLSGASSDWEGVAKVYAEIDQKNKNLEMMTTVESKLLDLKSQNAKIVEQLKENPDAENYFKNWQQAFDTNAQNIAEEIKDTDVRSKFNLELIRYKQSETVNQIHAGYLLLHDEQFGKVKDILQKLGDQGDKERGIEVINGAAANGLIKKSQEPDIRAAFLKQIDATNERLRNELQRQIDKAAETNADLYLARKYGENYDAAIKDLGKPEIYTKLSLTAEQATNLANIINNRKIRSTENRRLIYENTNQRFFLMDQDGLLDLDIIKEAVEFKALDVPSAQAWEKRLEVKMKEPDGKVKTDWVVYNKLNDLAWNHPDKGYVSNQVMANVNSLAETQIHELLNRNQTKFDETTKRARSEALTLIKPMVIPTRGMMEPFLSTPQENYDFSMATEALDKAIMDARTKDKSLTYDEIIKKGREIAQGYSKPMYQRMQDMKKYMMEQMKPPIKTPEVKPKTDVEIKKLLRDNGFKDTDENIAIFKKNNRMK